MELRYERRYPPLINASPETEIAATAAASLVGDGNVRRNMLPSMGAEDFACFLERKCVFRSNVITDSGGR